MNPDWTDRLLRAFADAGLTVRDVRADLPRHATRTYATRDPEHIRGMVWHQALCYGYGYRTVENIARYHISAVSHLKAGGAPGFAYTMAVDADGTVYLANGVDVATWSHGQHLVPDANAALVGVCALGWYSYTDAQGVLHAGDEPPPPQEAALIRVWQAARTVWGWASDQHAGGLLGHEDLGKPSCPGNRLNAVQDALRAGHAPPPLVGSLALTGHARLSYQQGCLAALGYDLGPSGVDGQDGPATRAAVTAYQQAHGLVPDGKWGVLTEASVLAEMRARYPHV